MPIVPAGSVNLAGIGVPNVYVQIVPPNPLLNGVPTNIVGIVGTASWGPVNSPKTIGSLQQLINTFGTPVARIYDIGTPMYVAMQQGANNFVGVRVTDGTDVAASADIVDTSMSPVTGAVLTSIYTGSYPNNNCYATISQGSTPATYNLSIYFNNGVPEVFSNIGGTGATFWANLVNAVNNGQNSLRGPSQLCKASSLDGIASVDVIQPGSYATLPSLSITGPGAGAALVPSMKVVSESMIGAGSGFVPADTLTLVGGTHSSASTLTVLTTQLVSLVINAAGSGYDEGDTLILAGGTSSIPVEITVTGVSAGGITGVSITNAGSFTANASSFTQASTSGSGTGATFHTLEFGVLTTSIATAGSYTVLPANPVSTTGGSGAGATFSILWGLNAVTVSQAGTGYTNTSELTVSGGGGSGGAICTLVLESTAGTPSLVTVPFTGGLDGAENVIDTTLVGSDVTPRTGMYALRNTRCSIGMLTDVTTPSTYQSQVTFGLSEGIYMQAVEAPGLQDNISGMVSALQGAAVQSYILKVIGGDWVYFNDPFNGITRLISPQGYVAGILSVTPAYGSSLNKQMTAITATQKTYGQRVYSDADLQQLITAGVDIVTSPIPAGSNLFGVRLGCNTSSNIVTKFDNYPRMINFLGATMVTGMGQFIGLPQTPDVQREARDTLSAFLSNLQQLGWIGTLDGTPAFSVILDSSNNTTQRVALGYMQADVQVVLFNIIQQLVINLQAGGNIEIQVLPPQVLQ